MVFICSLISMSVLLFLQKLQLTLLQGPGGWGDSKRDAEAGAAVEQ